MTRIIICGSNSVVLAGLVSILDSQPDLEIIGHCLDGVTPISLSDRAADLLVLERSHSETFDEEIQSLEQGVDLEMTGILLTDSLRTAELNDYLQLGFRGFLPRLTSADEIIAAINAVIAGLIVIHPELVSFHEGGWSDFPTISNHSDETGSAIAPLPSLDVPLTSREIEILQLLKTGLDNKAIASTLQISKHTVKFHISSILSKLNVSSRTEAVTLGLRQGLISL